MTSQTLASVLIFGSNFPLVLLFLHELSPINIKVIFNEQKDTVRYNTAVERFGSWAFLSYTDGEVWNHTVKYYSSENSS